MIRTLDRDAAAIALVGSNLHREHILPSEKAFACKMKMEAIKRQGRRSDITLSQVATKLDAVADIGKKAGESRDQVFRYIRLTHLTRSLLNLSDDGQIALTPGFRDQLMALKARQEENRRLAGNSYNQRFVGYVFVDELGNLFRPGYVSERFRVLLKQNGLPPIRFHDLRHSCATLLVQSGMPINNVSEWVGHSDVTTTLKFYSHLDDRSKIASAQQMASALTLPECTLPRPWE